MYNDDNIFAKILSKKIPCKLIYENDFALAFYDIFPKSKIHALVIPKGKYLTFLDFTSTASLNEVQGFFAALKETTELLNLPNGFRVISNTGKDGGQEVPHFHMHILGGEDLGPLIRKP
ncbi:HIT domain-containing protein [Candidatus Hepatincolaceae symbiont of Richtersius coronifer]